MTSLPFIGRHTLLKDQWRHFLFMGRHTFTRDQCLHVKGLHVKVLWNLNLCNDVLIISLVGKRKASKGRTIPATGFRAHPEVHIVHAQRNYGRKTPALLQWLDCRVETAVSFLQYETFSWLSPCALVRQLYMKYDINSMLGSWRY